MLTNSWFSSPCRAALICLICLISPIAPTLAQAPPDLTEALESATKTATAKAAHSIVQIQTLGGEEIIRSGQQGILRGEGPTTGVIVSADGYIVSSSFNFAHNPSAINVMIPGNQPRAAKIVAHDKTRMVTLLKVEADGLPVAVAAPKDALRVGQWAIALGRSWASNVDAPPSVSVGIISALDRIWGKAVQTDAKVSPANYGGPLIDLDGRVIGILAPLSPRAEGETAGLEWYDSGIGFAVPMEDILQVLPKLKEGRDLERGLLGVNFKSVEPFTSVPTVRFVMHDSPALKAGIQADDIITEINGKPIVRYAQIKTYLGPKYAGDFVALKLKRGDEVIDIPKLELMGTPTSHQHAFLGILPMRDDPSVGLEVRYVFKDSPAEKAGIKAGDRLLTVAGRPFRGRDNLLRVLNMMSPGTEIEVGLKRKDDEKTEKISVTLATIVSEIPAELPTGTAKKALEKPRRPMVRQIPAQPNRLEQPPEEEDEEDEKVAKKEVKKGRFDVTSPLTAHSYWAYVPENYDPNISYALLVWLHPAGNPSESDIIDTWKAFCDKHHIIILAPQADAPAGWVTSEVDLIKADIRAIVEDYTIDRQRIIAHGLAEGAVLAHYLAFDAREMIRGVISVAGAPPAEAKENVAHQRLSFFLISAENDVQLNAQRAAKVDLIAKKFGVIYRELPGLDGDYGIGQELMREMARWVDSLDRM